MRFQKFLYWPGEFFSSHPIALLTLLFCLTVHESVSADVWGFVDEQGISHIASERIDGRYSLFYRSPIRAVKPDPKPVLQTEIAAPLLQPKLAEFFESSPRYRQIQPLLKDASRTFRIEYELLKAVIATESAFNASAVSSKGAIGLMQVMPDTARRFGLEGDRWLSLETKLANPAINIQTGSRYLRFLIDLFPGQLDLALASYNAGEGAVKRAGNRVPNYKETQAYVVMVREIYDALKSVAASSDNLSPSIVKPNRHDSGLVRIAPLSGGAIGRANMISSIQAGITTGVETTTD